VEERSAFYTRQLSNCKHSGSKRAVIDGHKNLIRICEKRSAKIDECIEKVFYCEFSASAEALS